MINPSLTQLEVTFLITLIEQVTQRGAFRAPELRDIGTIYERLKEVYNANWGDFSQNNSMPENGEE